VQPFEQAKAAQAGLPASGAGPADLSGGFRLSLLLDSLPGLRFEDEILPCCQLHVLVERTLVL